MSDYEVSEINQFDDPLAYFAISLYFYLVTFKDVVKKIKVAKNYGL